MERNLHILTQKDFDPFNNVFDEISQLIDNYNLTHPAEMLPKTPKQLEIAYDGGFSVIVLNEEGKVIGHAALYPLLDANINDFELKLAEFGSWIIDPTHRHRRINGLTVGEAVAKELIARFPNLPIIATVKRLNSFRGLQRIGFQPLNFYDLPFVAALTCVCPNSSEHFGHQCHYRRRENYGLRNGLVDFDFQTSINNEPPMIPCTLLGYNLEALMGLNENLRQLILEYYGNLPEYDLSSLFTATRNFFRNHNISIL